MDVSAFARDHISQITATTGLVTYAIARKKLTAGGIVAGIFVATIHMIHPWPAFFWLLMLFFLFGTFVTKVGSSLSLPFKPKSSIQPRQEEQTFYVSNRT